MRILVWGINYLPELIGIAPYNTALCEFLRARGHDVRMLTTFPYYPAWQKLPGDCGRLYRTDDFDGVPVYRCWHYVPRRPSVLRRIAHEGSFVAVSFLRLAWLPRPEALVVVSPPLLLGMAAWVMSRLKGCPFIFHVQDLQPDAALGLGMLRPGGFMRVLYALESLAYRKAARVSGISRGMMAVLVRKGVAPDRIVYFPNGVELRLPDSLPPPGRFRARLGYGADDFLVVYSGNLGVKQGLDVLIAAAEQVRSPRVRFVLCGDGAQRSALAEAVAACRVQTVRLLPVQPEPAFHELMRDTDLSVIAQQRGSGAVFFPSKLLTCLAFGRPVLAVADPTSELARAVAEGEFGLRLDPDRPDRIAAAIDRLVDDAATRARWGAAGAQYVEQFESKRVLAAFEQELQKVVADGLKRDGTPSARQ